MSTTYPHDAYMLFMRGDEVSTRPLKAPRNFADPVEAYADSLYATEDDAIRALGRMTVAEVSDFDVIVESVTIHEDGFISTENAEYERSEVFSLWGVADDHAPKVPQA